MDRMDLDRVNHFALAKHHLTPSTRIDDLVQIAGDVGGLHATAVTTPYLSLWPRTSSFSRCHLQHELYERRTLAKLRCVRNTIYIHPLQALPFVFQATVAAVTRGSRRFMEARGISPALFRDISKAIIALFEAAHRSRPKEMTASTIKAALHTELDISAVLNLLCDQGVLVRASPVGSWRDRRQHYALFAKYFPNVDLDAMDERKAIRHLVRHYLVAFGPLTENDIVWWTGLGKRKVGVALTDLADQVTKAAIDALSGEYILLCSQVDPLQNTALPIQPIVNLLPVLDPYLMGYKDRARYLDDRDQDFVFDRSGNATSTIVISGRVAGVWDTGDDDKPAIKLFLFHPVDQPIRQAVESEASRLGRFIFDQESDIRWCSSMVPLTERTAGSMMSPLKGCPP